MPLLLPGCLQAEPGPVSDLPRGHVLSLSRSSTLDDSGVRSFAALQGAVYLDQLCSTLRGSLTHGTRLLTLPDCSMTGQQACLISG